MIEDFKYVYGYYLTADQKWPQSTWIFETTSSTIRKMKMEIDSLTDWDGRLGAR